MVTLSGHRWVIMALLPVFVCLSSCGLLRYPGQMGQVTNGYSKVDLEHLDGDGLWVYEVSYDNRLGGQGVAAVVTKLYPGARTFTSNGRSGPDGTYYRVKEAYKGAQVQMIYLPPTGQIIMPPDSKVQLFMDYDVSLDEVDDKNLAETNLFDTSLQKGAALLPLAERWQEIRFKISQLATYAVKGRLDYRVKRLRFDGEQLQFETPILFSTNRQQNAIRGQFQKEDLEHLVDFMDSQFPMGFKGVLGIVLDDGESVRVPVKLYTKKSLLASGRTITVEDSSALLAEKADKWSQKK